MQGFLKEPSERYIRKQASVLSLLKDIITGAGQFAVGAGKLGFDVAKTIATWGLVGSGLLGAGAGYAAARATSPDIATSHSDQDIAREALETEIDITKRKIAQLERRQKAEKAAEKKKVYDRFV